MKEKRVKQPLSKMVSKPLMLILRTVTHLSSWLFEWNTIQESKLAFQRVKGKENEKHVKEIVIINSIMMVVTEIISEIILLIPFPVAIWGCFLCLSKIAIKVNKLWRYKEADVLPWSEAQFQ